MAEIQRGLSCAQRAPSRALQCFPRIHSVRPVPLHRHNCDEGSPFPPTSPASSRALPAGRVSPFQTVIWSRPWAPLHGLTLTTMSLHTMSVIYCKIEETDSIIVLTEFCWSAASNIDLPRLMRSFSEVLIFPGFCLNQRSAPIFAYEL